MEIKPNVSELFSDLFFFFGEKNLSSLENKRFRVVERDKLRLTSYQLSCQFFEIILRILSSEVTSNIYYILIVSNVLNVATTYLYNLFNVPSLTLRELLRIRTTIPDRVMRRRKLSLHEYPSMQMPPRH